MRIFLFALMILSSVLVSPAAVNAIENPHSVPNNRFGIHLADPHDIAEAANLVNSSGGEWGYVTLVITQHDRDIEKWQKYFDQMRGLKLIPIIRIASIQTGAGWEKLNESDLDNWVYFLNSLNWVIKNRYVVVGNETNHSREWGGEVKPDEYARYLKAFSKKLKMASGDFFILPAGFDASAPDDKQHMSLRKYLSEMKNSENDVFDHIDGWTSHSYPNPDFSGSEDGVGLGSIRSFLDEIEYLKQIGVVKELPVFITETGWAHNRYGEESNFLDTYSISSRLKYAYENVWSHGSVAAVTPFVFSYYDPPFNVFSWRDKDKNYYPFLNDFKRYTKIKGDPVRIVNGEIKFVLLPKIAAKGKTVTGFALVRNSGQRVWERDEIVLSNCNNLTLNISGKIPSTMMPGDTSVVNLRADLPDKEGSYLGSIRLGFGEVCFGNEHYFKINTINPFLTPWETIFEVRRLLISLVNKTAKGES